MGTEVWSAKHPFTLWEAAVTDDGTVAGYAYRYGWAGVPDQRPSESATAPGDSLDGDFHVVILDSAGKTRLSESTQRRHTGFLHAPSEPVAKGIFIDAENDRFVVKVVSPGSDCERECWWTYRLSTGQNLDRFEPRQLMPNAESACFLVGDQPIHHTPLTLLQWETPAGNVGTRFTLIDPKGKPVWILDLPLGHELTGNPVADSLLSDEIRRQSVILASDRPGRFELLANKKRLAFQVTQAPDSPTGWRVSKTTPANDIAPPASAPAPAEPAAISLERLGTITLEADRSPPHPIRCVDNFEFDGRGRIAFIRRENQDPGTFMLVRADGKVEREIPLRGIIDDWWPRPRIAWVDNDRWIIVVSSYQSTKARAWWLDVGSSSLTPVGAFDYRSIRAITGTCDGGFTFLTDAGELIAIDKGSHARWRIGQDQTNPAKLFCPTDIAVTTNGQIAVLDDLGRRVQYYALTGQHLRTVDLEKTLEGERVSPSKMAAEAEGGVIVHGHRSSPLFYRLATDGTTVRKLQARYENGRLLSLPAGVKAAPDSRLWACDGTALLRLTDEGVVDRVLGEPPRPDQLGELAAFSVDHSGHAYAVSSRTGAVHVFDGQGKLLRICEPLPTDFPSNEAPERIVIAGDGSVYIESLCNPYLHFGPDGQRIGFEKINVDGFCGQWLFQPGSGRRWVACGDTIRLVGEDGRIIRSTQRRPDRNWIEWIEALAVAPDGSLAVLERREGSLSPSNVTINLYNSAGDPIRTMTQPDSRQAYSLAYTGKHVIVPQESELLIFSADGGPPHKFKPVATSARNGNVYWYPIFWPAGNELWLLRPDRREIYRYSLSNAPLGSKTPSAANDRTN